MMFEQYNEIKHRVLLLLKESIEFIEQISIENGHSLIYPALKSDVFSIFKTSYEFQNFVLDNTSRINLMKSKLSEVKVHISRLIKRINDNKSRILVTGDVNSGKSTFINALVRKNLLPIDQQPCTQVFCEILEEESDFTMFQGLKKLSNEMVNISQNIFELSIQENDTEFDFFNIMLSNKFHWMSNSDFKVTIIDSPGLNCDVTKTMSLFARQDDIDVIIFLINACNHLTLSAHEFLSAACQEKTYIFVVVNKIDEVFQASKCKKSILRQLEQIVPLTASDPNLVHFVSSKKRLDFVCDANDNSLTSSTSTSHQSLGEYMNQFEHLENQLKSFLSERRSHSKLLPAYTYLKNFCFEINIIINFNQNIINSKIVQLENEMELLSPIATELAMHEHSLRYDLTTRMNMIMETTLNSIIREVNNFDVECIIQRCRWKGLVQINDFFNTVRDILLEEYQRLLDSITSRLTPTIQKNSTMLHSIAHMHVPSIFPQINDQENSFYKFKLDHQVDCISIKMPSLWSPLPKALLYGIEKFLFLGTGFFSLILFKKISFIPLHISKRFFLLCSPMVLSSFLMIKLMFINFEELYKEEIVNFLKKQHGQLLSAKYLSDLMGKVSQMISMDTSLILKKFDGALREQQDIKSKLDLEILKLQGLKKSFEKYEHHIASIKKRLDLINII